MITAAHPKSKVLVFTTFGDDDDLDALWTPSSRLRTGSLSCRFHDPHGNFDATPRSRTSQDAAAAGHELARVGKCSRSARHPPTCALLEETMHRVNTL
jgi:hypothetical protein